VPGYRVVIADVVGETGISTIPVREAMRRLEAEGFLEFVPNIGARVASFDPEAYEQSVQVIARLEGYVTALAAPRLTPAQLAAAREVNEEMRVAVERFDPLGLDELNRMFHFTFYDNCGDSHLVNLISTEWFRLDFIRRGALRSIPQRARNVVEEHEALLGLVERGAPAAEIESAARQHRLDTLLALD
jgi:DNA-binding GntR family transcriptional regulator